MSIVLPKRSIEFGVGKEIRGSVYLHRLYEVRLGALTSEIRQQIPASFDYTVVKYDRRSGNVSFIVCPDFDACPEPALGDIWTVSPEGIARFRRRANDPYIYHHKWLMVQDDYTEFDVEESKQRSRLWFALDGIDKSRIGRLSYWQNHVARRNNENW